ncbi:MAG TPA: hypothetical protein VFS33_11640 [Gemmatimonadales bacterium]|nr:hypothetical protein [Gemmatimonadales bacterium]
MLPTLRWSTGFLIGLVGAATGVLVLLLAGLVTAAGGAAVIVTRLADRVHVLTVGLVLVMIIVEMGFLVFSTEAAARGRIDTIAWRSILIAHAAADLVFVLLLLRAHPSLLTDLRAGYDT